MGYKNESLINTIELGRAIKRRREDLGLSLRDVADKTNVSASTLSRIENGTGKPDADNIARLASWLDMPVDRVMKKISKRWFIIRTKRRRKLSKRTCAPTKI
jgi:transcriptional regulator with XRE-family HTH domain